MGATAGRRWRRAWGGVVWGLIVAVGSLSAAGEPEARPTPGQVRQRTARVPVRSIANPGAARRPTRTPSRAPAAQGPQYRFRRGQSFAYSVEIATGFDGGSRIERFRGTPFVTVMSVSESGEAELFVIGKLECSSFKKDGSSELLHRAKTVWLGSRIAIQPSGGWHGKDDVGADGLPDFFRTLNIQPKHLLFPELPRAVPSVDDSEGRGSLLGTGGTGSLAGVGFNSIDGRVVRSKRADRTEPPYVRLTNAVSFRTDPKVTPRARLSYRSIVRFDPELGRLRESDASYRLEVDGSSPTLGSIRVRTLSGEALRRAREKAIADWPGRPSGFDPIEVRRVAVDAFLPDSLESSRDAQPGMAILHLRGTGQGFQDADNKYYLAEVLSVDPKPEGPIKIRYKGSNEVLSVPFRTLAFPISPAHPGRAPRSVKAAH